MKASEIKAMQNMVLIDISDFSGKKEEVTESGIVIQKQMKDLVMEEVNGKQQSGIVTKRGPDCRYVQEGDRVLLPNKRGLVKGRLVDDEEKVYIWVAEDHIPAIIEE